MLAEVAKSDGAGSSVMVRCCVCVRKAVVAAGRDGLGVEGRRSCRAATGKLGCTDVVGQACFGRDGSEPSLRAAALNRPPLRQTAAARRMRENTKK